MQIGNNITLNSGVISMISSDVTNAMGNASFKNGGIFFSADATLGATSNFGLNFQTNNLNWLTISSSGNVGVGTTTPNSRLQVAGGEIQPGSSAQACTTANAGAVRWDVTGLSVCSSLTWNPVTVSYPASAITITSVVWGYGGGTNSCGTYVQNLCNGNTYCSYDASNANCGDPSPGNTKSISVTYVCNGVTRSNFTYEAHPAAIACSMSQVASGASFLNVLGGSNVAYTNTPFGIGNVPSAALDVSLPISATSGQALGARVQQTLTASSKTDVLTGLFINPTFNDNGQTGVVHNGLIVSSGKVGIGTAAPAQKLSVVGTIESTAGGFKFPDGTTQTTASAAAAPTWTSYSPVASPGSGSYANVTETGRYVQFGKTVTFTVKIAMTNVAGSGTVLVSLPTVAASDAIVVGRENAVTGKFFKVSLRQAFLAGRFSTAQTERR